MVETQFPPSKEAAHTACVVCVWEARDFGRVRLHYVVFCLDKTLPHMKFCIGTLPMNGRKPEEAYYMFLDEIQAVVDMKD